MITLKDFTDNIKHLKTKIYITSFSGVKFEGTLGQFKKLKCTKKLLNSRVTRILINGDYYKISIDEYYTFKPTNFKNIHFDEWYRKKVK